MEQWLAITIGRIFIYLSGYGLNRPMVMIGGALFVVAGSLRGLGLI